MVDFECVRPYGFDAVRKIMEILRSPQGCPWDAEQTHASIRDNLLEECCEAMEAIDLNDAGLLCEELGDVLLQVVFHTAMAEESGEFTFTDVTDTLCGKLIERHPHVFGTTHVSGVSDVLTNWESVKRAKKGHTTVYDAMRSVAATLPPRMRARKLMKLAERAGLTLPDGELLAAVDRLKQAEEQLEDACRRYVESSKCAEAPGDA